jgi:predicted esterase
MAHRRNVAPLAVCLLLAGCFDNNSNDVGPETGLRTLSSGGLQRTWYLDLPSDYDPAAAPRPLIIAYHGTGGSHQAWLDYSPLREVVGDGAILVYPDALPNAANINQWDFSTDFRMFEDLLAQLPALVNFDASRIFITGHSSGGGFAHELGCKYGDRIRAIAPVAGSLTATTCVGAVAGLQIHGEFDPLVPVGVAQLGHRFWTLYNGFNLGTRNPGIAPECVDHAAGPSDYPVQWCLHQEGQGAGNTAHDWPVFASAAIWDFFRGLPDRAPQAEPPPGGGNARALGNADTTLSFTLRYPSGIPNPMQGVAVLYPAGTRQPIGEAPLAFLNLSFAPGAVAGDERSYQIPVKYLGFDGFPGRYALDIAIYVEGGSFPIPAAGVDQTVLADVDLVDAGTPIVVPGVLTLEPVRTTF